MIKKPTIYKEKWNQKNNNKNYCYLKDQKTIEKEVEKIFDSLGPIYKKKVEIETTKGTIETYLIKKENQSLQTIDHRTIPMEEIMSIKRIS